MKQMCFTMPEMKSLESEMVEREQCILIRRAPEPGRSPGILFLPGAEAVGGDLFRSLEGQRLWLA